MYGLEKMGLCPFESDTNWYGVIRLAMEDAGFSLLGSKVLANLFFSGHGYLGRVQDQLRYTANIPAREHRLDYILAGL